MCCVLLGEEGAPGVTQWALQGSATASDPAVVKTQLNALPVVANGQSVMWAPKERAEIEKKGEKTI